MSTEERSESLASQAAAWVPPWERRRTPDAAATPALDLDPASLDPASLDPARLDPAGPDSVSPDWVSPGSAGLDSAAPDSVSPDQASSDQVSLDRASLDRASLDQVNFGPFSPDEPGAERTDDLPVDRSGDRVDDPAIPEQGRGSRDPGAGRRRTPRKAGPTATVPEPVAPPIDDTELRAALEAILLVVDEPVADMQLAQIMDQPTERVTAMLEDISAGYTRLGHGFDLRRAAGGWRLYTRPEYAAYVEKFVLDGQSVRLTQAALETLAVVAYKQPVTRSRISVIRGVNCDGVMRTLVTRGLIEECGVESETGAFLYRTTVLFLEKLGLNSVDQLPSLAPFLPDDVEEVLDAQR